jgi:hypothetical protein
MKKHGDGKNAKLVLVKNAIRALTDHSIEQVVGGSKFPCNARTAACN